MAYVGGVIKEAAVITRVLVGVDFSDASRQALDRAAGWAGQCGVPLVAMHVLQPPAPMLPEAQLALPDPTWLHGMEGHAREQLEAWLSPYPGATAELTLAAAADARWEPLATVAPNSPAGLRQICNRAMARDPADRFRDATEMALALDGFLSTAVLAQPDRRVERFATATVVAAGLLLLVMTLGVWSTVGSLREQGVVSLMYLSVAAMGGALSLVEWRTDGRHKLDALILVFAMLTFLFGITGSAMGLESVLARVAELGSADPTWLAGQGAGALLRGCWEALGGIPSSAHLAAAQLLAWGILRRKRQKANAG